MSKKSQHIGYKKCRDERIVMLEIIGDHNEEREDIVDKRFAKMRCSKARVIRIYNMHDRSIEYEDAFGIYDKSFKYVVGEVVEPVNNFNRDPNKLCAIGIHYFLKEEPAYFWNYMPKNGLYKSWHPNGQIFVRCTYKNERTNGPHKSWHSNGQMRYRYTYKNGEIDGLYKEWYDNGQMSVRCTHKNGMLDGSHKSWYSNGQKLERCTYKDGELHGLCKTWHSNGKMKGDALTRTGSIMVRLWYGALTVRYGSSTLSGTESSTEK